MKCIAPAILPYAYISPQMTPVYWPTKKEKPFVVAQLSVTLLKQEIEEEYFSIAELEITLDKKVSVYHCPTIRVPVVCV